MKNHIHRAVITLADRDEPIAIQLETKADHQRWRRFFAQLVEARASGSRELILAPHQMHQRIAVVFDPQLVTRITVDMPPGKTGFDLFR
jgi:hypothetical protein